VVLVFLCGFCFGQSNFTFCLPQVFTVESSLDLSDAFSGSYSSQHNVVKTWYDSGSGKLREDVITYSLQSGKYVYMNYSYVIDAKLGQLYTLQNGTCTVFNGTSTFTPCRSVSGILQKGVAGGSLDVVSYVSEKTSDDLKVWGSFTFTAGSSPLLVQQSEIAFSSSGFDTGRIDYINWSTDPIDQKIFYTCDSKAGETKIGASPAPLLSPHSPLFNHFIKKH